MVIVKDTVTERSVPSFAVHVTTPVAAATLAPVTGVGIVASIVTPVAGLEVLPLIVAPLFATPFQVQTCEYAKLGVKVPPAASRLSYVYVEMTGVAYTLAPADCDNTIVAEVYPDFETVIVADFVEVDLLLTTVIVTPDTVATDVAFDAKLKPVNSVPVYIFVPSR